MSKQKLSKYFLGVAVIAIWGTLFFRIYQAIGTDEESPPRVVSVLPLQKVDQQEQFSLLLDYNDPFLPKKYFKQKPKATAPRKTIPRAPVTGSPKKQVVFPKISYKGYIGKQATKKVLVSIAGKSVPLKEGAVYEGLRIARVFPDSIWISYKGASRTFIRQ